MLLPPLLFLLSVTLRRPNKRLSFEPKKNKQPKNKHAHSLRRPNKHFARAFCSSFEQKKDKQPKNKHAHSRIRVRSSTCFHFPFCSRSVYLDASQLDGGTTRAAILFEGAASGEMRAVLERKEYLKSQCPSTIIKETESRGFI